jgi:hypothetical protein
MNTIIDRIEDLRAQGLNDTKVKAFLILEDYTAKEIAEAFKSLGGAKKVGFRESYYDFLVNNPGVNRIDAEYFIMNHESSSDNVKKHLSHYLQNFDLVSRVRATLGAEEPSVEPKEETKEESKSEKDAAWDFILAAKEAYERGERLAKAKVHPDRVAKFKDAALTKAYTELFQELNPKKKAA